MVVEMYGTHHTMEFTIPPKERSGLCLNVEQDIKEHH